MSNGNTARKHVIAHSSSTKSRDSIRKTLDSRQSSDLVIAFCGAIGSRINEDVLPIFTRELEREGYHCHELKISELIIQTTEQFPEKFKSVEQADTSCDRFNRYTNLQNLGNEVRNALGDDALARLCIQKIAVIREQHSYTDTDKVAFLITQIKHPAEVTFFRLVYLNLFYLIGTLCSAEQRRHNLIDKERIPEDKTSALIARDKNENDEHGQKLEKVLHESDLFINNSSSTGDHRQSVIRRFLGLVHGENGLTPTSEESGMYAAYIASLRSACLSRQVGAAITNEEGVVVATGCNDVPKFGGGLYDADTPKDNRCVHYE